MHRLKCFILREPEVSGVADDAGEQQRSLLRGKLHSQLLEKPQNDFGLRGKLLPNKIQGRQLLHRLDRTMVIDHHQLRHFLP
ncbi:hypothetical protein ES703_95782 [subsurface metagenome]